MIEIGKLNMVWRLCNYLIQCVETRQKTFSVSLAAQSMTDLSTTCSASICPLKPNFQIWFGCNVSINSGKSSDGGSRHAAGVAGAVGVISVSVRWVKIIYLGDPKIVRFQAHYENFNRKLCYLENWHSYRYGITMVPEHYPLP